MYLINVAKAISGFIDLPAGRKWYTSRSSQTNLSVVCSQLESTPSGKGSDGSRFRLPLPFCVASPVPFAAFSDRWGPEEEAIWVGKSVFCGTPGTWKDRN